MSEFGGKVALITGAASGIGSATARMLVAAGVRVVIADIDVEAGAELAAELGDAARFVELDVRSPEQIEFAVSDAVRHFGRLDIVFNNAGMGLNAPLTDHTLDQIEALIAINLRAPTLMCRAALPHLRRNREGGVIINNSSNGGLVGRAPDPVYVATKHGLVGLTKSLALAHAHERIRVNAICAGPIDTPMAWGNFAGLTDRSEALHRMLATCPDPRLADPDEVAAAVVFLCSDAARFINGIALPIDGGKAAGVMRADRYRLDFELSEPPADQEPLR